MNIVVIPFCSDELH